ncbi:MULTISPECIES: PLP-dependent cysteine synthase family protein [Halobacterium]|nr:MULTISPECIES: PLP-dependent cysteine synthase family protein [Halobacterium]MBB6089955.1 cysteine synthase A [Halobacterium salinarum]MCF2165682.1 PLP-dependent cysteine synthase family protein [Halobacterium salinarum]MCF2166552.1 PLP-dependent cysteine synthase family protein [Halobacterium salinarum]MCF2207876.1 PLP-dependent cysteine synthase family protein [Halobacterium salinarum]MCF2238345.1 PLP-dependent cysteine synthase family protein [Halobacterium salinarum]
MTTHDRPLDSVLDTVGETPLVRVQAAPDDVPVYAKLESFNPGASIKDRIGTYMIEQMLASGELPEGGTIIEPTAGNTGVGFAVAASQLGIDAVFVVPERFSLEKQQLMRALGADVVNTPTDDGMGGAIQRAHDLAAEREDAIVPQQFSNPLNAEAHYETTGPEIYHALDGAVGAFVAGCGTAGTLMGTSRFLRDQISALHVTAVEPEGSMYASAAGADVSEGEYKTEGIGTHDPSTSELFDPEFVDDVTQIPDEDTHAEMQRLAAEEAQLVASSAAANSLAAIDVAERAAAGHIDLPHDCVVTVFPDSSERYLSKGLYGDYEEWEG